MVDAVPADARFDDAAVDAAPAVARFDDAMAEVDAAVPDGVTAEAPFADVAALKTGRARG